MQVGISNMSMHAGKPLFDFFEHSDGGLVYKKPPPKIAISP